MSKVATRPTSLVAVKPERICHNDKKILVSFRMTG